MPADPVSALQLHLFASHSPAYQEALAYYEEIRPILTREHTLAQQSRAMGFNYWRLWRHLRRFRRNGLLGLIDRRKLPSVG
jgi:leucine-zipper of insertion element IS481